MIANWELLLLSAWRLSGMHLSSHAGECQGGRGHTGGDIIQCHEHLMKGAICFGEHWYQNSYSVYDSLVTQLEVILDFFAALGALQLSDPAPDFVGPSVH